MCAYCTSPCRGSRGSFFVAGGTFFSHHSHADNGRLCSVAWPKAAAAGWTETRKPPGRVNTGGATLPTLSSRIADHCRSPNRRVDRRGSRCDDNGVAAMAGTGFRSISHTLHRTYSHDLESREKPSRVPRDEERTWQPVSARAIHCDRRRPSSELLT